MTEILNQFVINFLHPFKTHGELRDAREKRLVEEWSKPLTLAENSEDTEVESSRLSFFDALSVSWLLYIIRGFYALAALHLGFHAFSFIQESRITEHLIPNLNIGMQKLALFVIILKIIFFPLGLWIYCKFWQFIISFFANLFEAPGDIDEISEEIVNQSLSSRLFYTIPILGDLGVTLSALFFLFAGLRRNLGLNPLQSMMVIISPVILMAFTGIFAGLIIFVTFNIF